MTVRREIKDHRRALVLDHVLREYECTGSDAFEQWQDRMSVAPIHEKINRRAEDEASRQWLRQFWEHPPQWRGSDLVRSTIISLEDFEELVARRRREERQGKSP